MQPAIGKAPLPRRPGDEVDLFWLWQKKMVDTSLVSRVKRLALDNIEWSQIGQLMNFTQRIISIMERDWNVELG